MARRAAIRKEEPQPRKSPYVGPYAFRKEDADLFCGRDHEAQHLLALAVSEQIVVFCAQSGAGKTSLVNARLIPGLEKKGFHVFPPARVGHKVHSDVAPDNVYVFSALGSLNPLRKPGDTLDGFLEAGRSSGPEEAPPRVLILDQFEEILTTHPEHWEQREAFFLQLRKALQQDPSLSVVLVMREDRIAGLDRYAAVLPGGFRVRFRMERLRVGEATTAIRRPAELAGRPFDPGVAEQLAGDLSQIRIAEQEQQIQGEFVEPVHLQVACLQLWEDLREQPGETITQEDLKKFGNVDRALETFYEDAVKRAAQQSRVSRGTIRHWCGTALITPSRIRSQVSRQARTTGGLPNEAVDALVDAHLLRPEIARGGTWYELAHDRLVEPILNSNQKWLGADKSQLAKDARAWQAAARDSSFLYQGKRLQEALESQESKGELEQEFLDAAKRWEEEQRRDESRRKNLWIAVLALGLLCAGALAFLALREGRTAFSRELAFAAMNATESDPRLGLALALAALDRDETDAAEAALHQGLQATAIHEVWSLPSAHLVAMSPDGRRLATAGADGKLAVWDVQTRRSLPLPRLPSIVATALAFDRTGRRLASGFVDGRVIVSSLRSEERKRGSLEPQPPLDSQPPLELRLGEDAINAVAFSPDGRLLAIAAAFDPTPVLWDLSSQERRALQGHADAVLGITFSRDGRRVATAGDDGRVILWETDSGQPISRLDVGEPLLGCALSPRGKIATFNQSGGVGLWDPAAGSAAQQISYLENPIVKATFSPDDRYLVGLDSGGGFHVWDTDSGSGSGGRLDLTIPGREISSAELSADLRFLATGESSLMTEAEGKPARLWRIEDLFAPRLVSGEIPDIAFRKDGKLLVTASGGEALLWEPTSDRRQTTRSCVEKELTAEGGSLACAGAGGIIDVWGGEDDFSGRPSASIQAFQPDYKAEQDLFGLGPNGETLATASNGQVQVWDLSSGRSPASLETETVRKLKLSSDLLATGHIDGAVRLWKVDSRSQEPIAHIEGRGSVVTGIAFSPDARRMAVIDQTGWSVRLFEIEARKESPILLPPGVRVSAIAFSPDGKRLATANSDRTVSLWDARTGNDLFKLRTYLQPIASIAFHPDGRSLAIALEDGTVWIDSLDPENLKRLAEGRSRELSDQEKRKYRLD